MSFYEVYTHVSEMHLSEIGLKTEWYEVDMNSTDKGQVTWEGIVRRVCRIFVNMTGLSSVADVRALHSVLEYPMPVSLTDMPARLLKPSERWKPPDTYISRRVYRAAQLPPSPSTATKTASFLRAGLKTLSLVTQSSRRGQNHCQIAYLLPYNTPSPRKRLLCCTTLELLVGMPGSYANDG